MNCPDCETEVRIYPYYCDVCKKHIKKKVQCPHCESWNTTLFGLAVTDKKECWRCNVCRHHFEVPYE